MEVYYEFQRQFLTIALEKADTVFYNIQLITGNKVALFKLIGHFAEQIKEVVVWDKLHGQPAARDGVLNSRYEFLFILSNEASRRRFDNALFRRGTLDNVWGIRVKKHKGFRAGFPLEFVEKILTNFVTKDKLVIDPFMGSCTTGIVCKQLGYDFIGIEFDRETCEEAVKRIKERMDSSITPEPIKVHTNIVTEKDGEVNRLLVKDKKAKSISKSKKDKYTIARIRNRINEKYGHSKESAPNR
jgi:site-specific DNA-methyltransferase (adenine-specific)/modification methylase